MTYDIINAGPRNRFCIRGRIVHNSGRGPQPQNLPSSGPGVMQCKGCGRVFWKGLVICPSCGKLRGPDDGCDWGAAAVEAALADIATRNLAWVEQQWGNACEVVSGCLRGLFSAAPGHDFLCSDFSAIEAVVLAELAGESWRQEVFRTHGKIYEMSASKITGIPFDDFMAYKEKNGVHHPMRKKVGKVAELASGYQGGLGAWKNFGADKFMSDEEIQANIKAWRAASPAIAGGPDKYRAAPLSQERGFWYGLQDAAHLAVQFPGNCYSYRSITYGVKDDVLYCKLPSGRCLVYRRPRLTPVTNSWGRTEFTLSFEGWNSNYQAGPVGWMRIDTFGGRLCENVVQAVARDILTHSMLNLARAGYPIVLHVHDEIVAEVPKGWGSIEEFERIMSTMSPWAAGWPVKAKGGWRGMRYRKD